MSDSVNIEIGEVPYPKDGTEITIEDVSDPKAGEDLDTGEVPYMKDGIEIVIDKPEHPEK